MESEDSKSVVLISSFPYPLAYLEIVNSRDGHPIDAVFLDVNPAFEKMIGLPKDHYIQKKTTEAPEEIMDLGLDWIHYYKQLSEKGSTSFEYDTRAFGHWYHVTIFSDREGFFYTLIKESTEETCREDYKKSLLFSQDILLETETIWINTFDEERNVILWNKGAQQMSGYTTREVTGHSTIWERLYPDIEYSMRIQEGFKKAMDKGEKIEGIETEIQRKDGLKRTILWNLYPLKNNGDSIGSLVLGVDITQQREAQESLKKTQETLKLQHKPIILPEVMIENLSLSHMIDVEATQALLHDFFQLTNFGVAIVDNRGEVLVKTGWQDICTQFHRVHPETKEYCIESDTELTKEVQEKSYKIYKCKNNMWDIATPIFVGQRHMGNLFLGQFFFDDEEIDYEVFKAQAEKYGFNQEAYLKALDQVPRWSKDTVFKVMEFYTRLAHMISLLGYNNIHLSNLIRERDTTIEQLREAEEKLALYSQKIEKLYEDQKRQINKARAIHQQNLPKELPKITGISFHAYYKPAQKIGGDFYDILHMHDKMILYLSDVSGHGIDGALLSVFIKHTIKGFFTYASSHVITPTNILQYLAHKFREENYPEEYFICIFLAVLDLKSMRLQYTGAGFQDYPLVLLGNKERVELKSKELFISPLFSEEEQLFKEDSISLRPGTTLFFNTDGLSEEENYGSFYGDRLPHVFYKNAHRSPSSIIKAVKQDFREFNNGSMQGSDDITFLVMKIKPTIEEHVLQ